MSIARLTDRQKAALSFIQDYVTKHGYPPTLEEIGKEMDIDSVSAVHKHVKALREKGYLKVVPNPTRSINVFDESHAYKEIPLMGKISAGAGIIPLENPEPISVSTDLLCGPGKHYALKIDGDSMIEDGIQDGDMVIVRHQNVAQNGDTVVAVINGVNELATLKKYYYLGDKIELRAANKNLKDWPKQFDVGDVEIRGKFCGLIRKGNNG